MNFQPVTDFLNAVDETFGVPACECEIWMDHRPLYRHTAGWLDRERTVPLRGGEWYWIYSCTKLMTMTAAMQLVEAGKLRLDDPVCRYLPEYAHPTVRDGNTLRPARTVLTVRHLMTMTGGFHYNQSCPAIVRARAESDNRATTREMIRALASEPLDFDPGTHFQYSLCHDVMGAVIEAASGERFSDYIQAHIAVPLGISGITFHPGAEEMARMPAQWCYHDQKQIIFQVERDNTHRLTGCYDSGGAGICCRAEDYIPFLDALACGGVGANGARILRPESVALLRTNQLTGVPMADYHRTMKLPIEGYGLGMRVRLGEDGVIPPGEFGWDGAAGANASMEPKRRLSVFYVQHVLNYLPNYADLHPRLMHTIYRCLDQ